MVGKLFHRNSHTTDPQLIMSFQEKDYNSLSVILNAKLDTCINRVVVKRKDDRTREEVKQYYDFFHKNFKSISKIRVGIEEISGDTDEKEPKQVCNEILGYFEKRQSLT